MGPTDHGREACDLLVIHGAVFSPCRSVCEMGEAKPSQHAGFVEICVAVCRPEFMARSSQLYYFMVSPDHQQPGWASAGHQPLYRDCWALLDLCGQIQAKVLGVPSCSA